MRAGEGLENLTAKIFRALTSDPATSGRVTVTQNESLEGADCLRQIDVVMRSKVGPIDLLTIIECKDYKRNIAITQVDASHSVQQDVKASKAVLVSRGGFSRNARRKAERLGIGLFRADQLRNVRDAAFEVPIYVREISQTSLDINAEFVAQKTGNVDLSVLKINDVYIPSALRDDLLANPSLHAMPPGRHQWDLAPPWFLRTKQGERIDLSSLEITYELVEQHYFGYLTDIGSAMVLYNELASHSTALLKAEDLIIDYARDLRRFDSAEDLPAEPVLVANVAKVANELDLSKAWATVEELGRAAR